MKTETLKTRNCLVIRHLQRDFPNEYYVLHFKFTTRSFNGGAGVLNFLENLVDEYELSEIDHWLTPEQALAA